MSAFVGFLIGFAVGSIVGIMVLAIVQVGTRWDKD